MSQRPRAGSRSQTAPSKMAVNGHFSSVGDAGGADYEHGVQVVDEEKEFKYSPPVIFEPLSCCRGWIATTRSTILYRLLEYIFCNVADGDIGNIQI